MITVRTQVKEILKEAGFSQISSDFMESLDDTVKDLITNAARRAQENGRKTVMGKDV